MNDQIATSVVEALYQAAVDPDGWRAVVEALEDSPPQETAGAAARRGAAHAEAMARLVVAREREAAPTPEIVGRVTLKANGRILALNARAESSLADALEPLSAGRAPTFRADDNLAAVRAAIARVKGGRADRAIVRLELADSAFCFGYLTAGAEGEFLLTLPGAEAVRELWASLSESFGLTPAEVRVVALFREGLTLREIAGRLDLSLHTVRNQLRAVFDKMGLQRQSELIRALSDLAPLTESLATVAPRDPVADAPPVVLHVLKDGRRLAYRDYGGGGRVLLMFHEGLGSSLLPVGAHGLATRLGLRVICPERPGFGQSDPREAYGFADAAEDVAELCDALGLGRIRLGGVLSGAPSAIETAIRLGPRAEEVLLCSGRPPRPTHGERGVVTQFRRAIEGAPWAVEALYAIMRLRLSGPFVKRLIQAATHPSHGDRAYAEANPWVADYIAAYVGECLAVSPRGVVAELDAFRRGGNATVEGLACPVTVWHGEEDQFSPLGDLLEYLGDRATEVCVSPGMGHLLGVRRWEDILRHAAR